MAIVLTNGKFYITHSETGAVIKVSDIKQAQDFHSAERAIAQKNKTPGKCAGYYFIDTDTTRKKPKKKKKKCKRKKFTRKQRESIFQKTGGICYLCGGNISFASFEIDHRMPKSKGGTDELSNLFPCCHCCNTIKHDIYPDDFVKKVSQIFMYQMERQYKDKLSWKIVHKMLNKMI